MNKPGDRVGALESIDNEKKEIRLYGYGVYVGEETPKYFTTRSGGLKNPKIKLDNGKEVWGYMCWWGDEEAIKRNVAVGVAKGYKVVVVDPPEDQPSPLLNQDVPFAKA